MKWRYAAFPSVTAELFLARRHHLDGSVTWLSQLQSCPETTYQECALAHVIASAIYITKEVCALIAGCYQWLTEHLEYPRAALCMLITHKELMTSWDGIGSRNWKWQILRVQREEKNWLSLPESLKNNKVVRILVDRSPLSSALLVPQKSQEFNTKP